MLLCTQFEDSLREESKNLELHQRLLELQREITQHRSNKSETILWQIIETLEIVIGLNRDLGEFFISSVEEVIALLCDYEHISIERIQNMPNFSKAWVGVSSMCVLRRLMWI